MVASRQSDLGILGTAKVYAAMTDFRSGGGSAVMVEVSNAAAAGI